LLRHPEVQNLRVARPGQHDVPGLDVPVDDPLGVGRLQRLRRLARDLESIRLVQRPLRQPLFQGEPFDVLHGEEASPVPLPHFVDVTDVRVIQRRRRPCFPEEAFVGRGVELQLRSEELQGHFAVEGDVVRKKHFPHAALADLLENAVVTESAADHGRSPPPNGSARVRRSVHLRQPPGRIMRTG